MWININTTIRNGTPFGSLSNDFILDSDAPGLGLRCPTSQTDPLDLDGDGNTAETVCRATGTITVAGIAQLVSSKTIQGTCDGGSVAVSSGTLQGGAIDYQLRVQNVGTVAMQNFVLIDILPFVGDTGVRDTNPRGSLWTPLLAAPITPPAGTTLFYSTSGNPCRGEVGGPTVGCDAPNWTTVPPVPISSVRSYKIEFGARVVQPFDFLSFNFLMVTPGTVPPGQSAFNSFAYQADRADGLGSLAAEPQKVGISIGACTAAALGDFVWADTNANGQQDDGPTGINGVPVFLWQPGTDGLAGTLDDIPISSSITSNSPTNTPGWYRFPGLAPGNYFVCIAAPPTFIFSPRDQGSDTSDSDANPATGCAPITVLGANQDIPTIDFGIVPTQRAALGDYVWFDRNNNGLQDESPFDGANGVSVRLWIDDGDSNPEPGTGDTLAATTVTDNDLYGGPGYYLFDGLIPGVRYFVQFIRPAVASSFTTHNAGGDDSADSDADVTTGVSANVILAPSEVNRSVDAGLISTAGLLSLGDQVWNEADNDGLFEPQNGELGVDDVRVDLYRDVNADGAATLDEYLATTTTSTVGGFAGRYRFNNLAAGNYIVVVAPQNFSGSGSLFNRITATGNDPAPDPDDDVNGDDNGTDAGALIAARPVTLSTNGEPTADDGDNNSNLTVDFGFIPRGAVLVPEYDYGDAPDVAAGTAVGDYNSTVLDAGAFHQIGVPGAPRLGACVDGDDGFNQDGNASGDDSSGFGSVVGVCATAGDDEDGVSFTGPFVPGVANSFAITASGAACTLNAWVDWNRSGVFGDSAGEQIASNVNIPLGPATLLNPVVPAGAVPGRSYARFRCASVGGLAPTAGAANGEVEDYVIGIVGRDYSDAPNTYATQGAGAASHVVDPLNAVYLGSCVDFEADGQPNVAASGDDIAAGTARVGLCLDDEDGVTFNTPIAACATASISVIASGTARLDAFIDFNTDGDFNDAAEQIFNNQALTAGSSALNFNVPCSAVAAPSYARFRLTSAGGVGPAGAAPNGEVEDYRVSLFGVDLGDAPAPFATLVSNNGARHVLDPASSLRLGACVDGEADGQPNATATGDDSSAGSATIGSCAVAGDDEDGVVFTPLVACRSNTVTVNAGAAGELDAWADYNRDGDWLDAGERIASGLNVTAGANAVLLNVPCSASLGPANLRFRLSSAGVADFVGAAPDGEIEDHQVAILGFDLGDLPDAAAAIGTGNYRTLLRGPGDSGPQHRIVSGLLLGATVDFEVDGQPNVAANGDDAAGIPDDEDGITIADLSFTTGLPATVRALVTNTTGIAGRLCGFADLNADGDFLDANETAFVDVSGATSGATLTLNFGTLAVNPVVYNLTPPNAPRFMRFRLADNQNACAADNDVSAPAGEVEDYLGNLFAPTDFGDLPDSAAGSGAGNYETLLANGGPYHPHRTGLRLGACLDAENNGQPNLAANGDDVGASASTQGTCAIAGDDEDALNAVAVAGLSNLIAGGLNLINVQATNQTGSAARLCGFVDFNGNGSFADAGETQSITVPTGSNNASFVLGFTPPAVAQAGVRYARFRLSTDTAGACSPNGAASDGEVEDYTAGIAVVDFGDLPDSGPGIGANNYVTQRSDATVGHRIDITGSTLFLGAGVDAEGDGQQSFAANGDDLNADDEDGLDPLVRVAVVGTQGIFLVRATNIIPSGPAANLCAYADWNGDGDFADATESASVSIPNGSNNVSTLVSFGAIPAGSEGQRYLRLRYSTALCSAQPASGGDPASLVDGEVEDYVITVRRGDFGDLPDPGFATGPGNYFTRIADSGAAHGIEPGLHIGACVDAEADGQPNAPANGDDSNAGVVSGTCAVSGDDEEGVNSADLAFISTLPAQIRATVTNTTGRVGTFCSFVDWNGDGDFLDTVDGVLEAGPHITVPGNSSNLPIVVDFGSTPIAPVGNSYARFRLSTQAGCSDAGSSLDGEVEDYAITITRRDFGDLPDSGVGTGVGNYQTRLNDNGAAHDIVDGLFMGASVDPEGDGQPNAAANGDDSAGDDEDGVNLTDLADFHLGSPANLRVIASNSSGAAAQLCGFIDWNRDGDFADSRETANIGVPNGSNAANFTLAFGAVPSFGPLGQSYARVRLQAASSACTPAGLVNAGEVEDYTVTVLPGEMSLGNHVWQDRDNSGTLDVGELPFPDITVTLFRDANDDGNPDGLAVDTQTTDVNGDYLFEELVPDTYLVCIDAPNDWISSSGSGRRYAPIGPNEPAADPDNDVNSDDNGSAGTPVTRICTGGVSLTFESEPTNDGDASNNSNLSVDFGLLYNFDLALRKQLSPGQDFEVDYGDTINYTITLFNQGTVTAQNIVITETIPVGMALSDAAWTLNGNIATRTVAGPLAAGASASVTISLEILDSAIPGNLRNVAEISAAQDLAGQPVPSIFDRDSDPDGTVDNDVEVDDEIGNGGGDEDDADPAVVNLGVGLLGVAKRALPVTINSSGPHSGSVNLTLLFELRNYGTRTVSQLSLIDDLRAQLPFSAVIEIVNITGDGIVVNSAFNGVSNTQLLAPGQSMAPNATALVVLQTRIRGRPEPRTYYNQASFSGTGPGDTPVGDDSTDGADPDPDDNDDPTDNDVPTPIELIGLLYATPIPTLDLRALLLLMLLLSAVGMRAIRR